MAWPIVCSILIESPLAKATLFQICIIETGSVVLEKNVFLPISFLSSNPLKMDVALNLFKHKSSLWKDA